MMDNHTASFGCALTCSWHSSRFSVLLAALLGMAFLAMSPHASAGETGADGTEGTLELRVLQYEAVLGDMLDASNGVCIDDAMGHRLDIPMGDEAGAQRMTQAVQAAADQCALARGSDRMRLVGGMRKAIDDQMFLRASSLAGARRCLDEAPNLDTLRSCVTAATGVAPAPAEWPRWSALYAQHARR